MTAPLVAPVCELCDAWFCDAAASPCGVALGVALGVAVDDALVEDCVVLGEALVCEFMVEDCGFAPLSSPDCGRALDVDVLWEAVSVLAGGCVLLELLLAGGCEPVELCELEAPVPVADCAVAPVWLLVPALWLLVLSAALEPDCGKLDELLLGEAAPLEVADELFASVEVEPFAAPIVPVEAEPPAPLTVRCSRTLFTPVTLFAMSRALLRSALFGTEPLKVARPFETVTFTFANSGFDAN